MRNFAEQVQLLDHAGEMLGWITPAKARQLVDEQKIGQYHSTKRRVRAVQLPRHLAGDPAYKEEFVTAAFGPNLGARYSHRRETIDNPAGVWTLKKITNSLRSFFTPEMA